MVPSPVSIAIQLAQLAQTGLVHITLIDPAPKIGRGLACLFCDDNLLLNVPAGNMSAFADDPGHFMRYCQTIGPSVSAGTFASRRLYGQYLQDTLTHTQAQHRGILSTMVAEAQALERANDTLGWRVHLASGQVLSVDQVVLAFGHQSPRFPLPLGHAEQPSVLDSWDFDAMHRLPSGEPVLVLGTGHTAVDALFCLSQAQPNRPITMVSRHGLMPLPHRINPNAPIPQVFPPYLQGLPPQVRTYLRAFWQHLRTLDVQGIDWRAALNELRPNTPQLWQSLPASEHGRFLRHLQVHRDVHRHRLDPMAAHRLDSLVASCRVRTVAARLQALKQRCDHLEVLVRHRGTGQLESIRVCAIANGTGPNADASRATNPLLRSMVQQGLIQPHPNGLGLSDTPQHQLLNAQQQPVKRLCYLGPMLKAQFWEATAVPDLRGRAQQMVHTFLASLGTKSHFEESS